MVAQRIVDRLPLHAELGRRPDIGKVVGRDYRQPVAVGIQEPIRPGERKSDPITMTALDESRPPPRQAAPTNSDRARPRSGGWPG